MEKYSLIIMTFLLILSFIAISPRLNFMAEKGVPAAVLSDRGGQPVSGRPETKALVYQNIQRVIYRYASLYFVAMVLLITLFFSTGRYFSSFRLAFRALFRSVILPEFIFMVPAAEKISWSYLYGSNLNPGQWQHNYFMPFTSVLRVPQFIAFDMTTLFAMPGVRSRLLVFMIVGFQNDHPSAAPQFAAPVRVVGEFLKTPFNRKLFEPNDLLSKKLTALSLNAGKINPGFELFNTINVIIVLILTASILHNRQISDGGLLVTIVLCFGMWAPMTKICQHLLAIAEGTAMIRTQSLLVASFLI